MFLVSVVFFSLIIFVNALHQEILILQAGWLSSRKCCLMLEGWSSVSAIVISFCNRVLRTRVMSYPSFILNELPDVVYLRSTNVC